jgi:pimeloyl-ACP methyl ester carboxylesterase
VILEAGAGNDADTWDTMGLPPASPQTAVLPGGASFTRVCAYDRPGTILDSDHPGRSDPAPMPRDASAMVADLHALLTAAGIPAPYVLAGHSFGGLIARLYAATYPGEVVGLVLIDAAHEDYYDQLRKVLTPAQWAAFTHPSDVPDPTVERIDVDASAEAMRAAAATAPSPPLPVVVLTHGRPWDWPTGYPATDLEAIWRPLQEKLAALAPDARLIVADQSGHFIPGDQPELVTAAIRQVVEAVRDPGAWPVGTAAPPQGVDARATPTTSVASPRLTPLLDRVLAPPHWFTGTDGQVHLVYELLLTNAISAPVTVKMVEVNDAATGATLMRLSGASLLAAMSLATSPETPAVVLPPSTIGVLWLDVPLASERDIPAAITHRLTIDPPPSLSIPASWLSYTGASVAVDRQPPVALGAPLSGSGWVALGSCCDGPHRRALYPIDGRWYLAQRFAIDFNQLDAQNRPGVGDPTLPSSFPTFGQPVLAVADATVVEAVDRYPDLQVGESREDVTPETAGGNRVILDLGGGRFAVYAHLQAGSVAVRPGDQVRRGQPIAKAGGSGTSGGPHLHFQVTDRPSVVVGDGLPYVFDAFALTGQTPPLADVLPYYTRWRRSPLQTSGQGRATTSFPWGAMSLRSQRKAPAAEGGSGSAQRPPPAPPPTRTFRLTDPRQTAPVLPRQPRPRPRPRGVVLPKQATTTVHPRSKISRAWVLSMRICAMRSSSEANLTSGRMRSRKSVVSVWP